MGKIVSWSHGRRNIFTRSRPRTGVLSGENFDSAAPRRTVTKRRNRGLGINAPATALRSADNEQAARPPHVVICRSREGLSLLTRDYSKHFLGGVKCGAASLSRYRFDPSLRELLAQASGIIGLGRRGALRAMSRGEEAADSRRPSCVGSARTRHVLRPLGTRFQSGLSTRRAPSCLNGKKSSSVISTMPSSGKKLITSPLRSVNEVLIAGSHTGIFWSVRPE